MLLSIVIMQFLAFAVLTGAIVYFMVVIIPYELEREREICKAELESLWNMQLRKDSVRSNEVLPEDKFGGGERGRSY